MFPPGLFAKGTREQLQHEKYNGVQLYSILATMLLGKRLSAEAKPRRTFTLSQLLNSSLKLQAFKLQFEWAPSHTPSLNYNGMNSFLAS